jgi:hypothetical protein
MCHIEKEGGREVPQNFLSDSEMGSLSIKRHTTFPTWNYTLNPITRM